MKTNTSEIIMIVFSGLILSCSAHKKLVASKNGYYKTKIYKSSSINKTVVCGNIYEYQTNTPLPVSVVKVNDQVLHHADTKGKYNFSIKPNKWKFTGAAMPYNFVETKLINVKMGDSIRIDFYLKSYTKPLVN